jgi:hypothetical protein
VNQSRLRPFLGGGGGHLPKKLENCWVWTETS